ncbi:MAG: MotA/TolQ/ExbB proton channel family protein [Candidatus Brocadiia bacterium]
MVKHIVIWAVSIGLYILGVVILYKVYESIPYYYTSPFNLVKTSGILGFVMIVWCFAFIIYGISDILEFRVGNIAPIKTIAELEPLMAKGQYDEALELCETSEKPLMTVVLDGLDKKDKGKDAIVNAMELSLQEMTFRINNKPNKYLFAGILALLIGAFSTASGMIDIFYNLYCTMGSPHQLSYSFEKILIIMTIGLTISMLNIFLYLLLRIRLNYYVFKLGAVSRKLIVLVK